MRTYGYAETIHNTTHLDVEVNKEGKVVAVWFRCQTLPFKQTIVTDSRSNALISAYKERSAPKLHAVELEDKE